MKRTLRVLVLAVALAFAVGAPKTAEAAVEESGCMLICLIEHGPEYYRTNGVWTEHCVYQSCFWAIWKVVAVCGYNCHVHAGDLPRWA